MNISLILFCIAALLSGHSVLAQQEAAPNQMTSRTSSETLIHLTLSYLEFKNGWNLTQIAQKIKDDCVEKVRFEVAGRKVARLQKKIDAIKNTLTHEEAQYKIDHSTNRNINKLNEQWAFNKLYATEEARNAALTAATEELKAAEVLYEETEVAFAQAKESIAVNEARASKSLRRIEGIGGTILVVDGAGRWYVVLTTNFVVRPIAAYQAIKLMLR